MATKSVRKVAATSAQIGGLNSSRFEKLEIAYGVIKAADYTVGDTIVFSGIPSKDIVTATITANNTTGTPSAPITLDVIPGTVMTSALPLQTDGTEISYVIQYVRNNGKVGSETAGDLLQIATQSGADTGLKAPSKKVTVG
jgi:hypothetical protein